MFHIPAHRTTTAAQVVVANTLYDCPSCGGWGHQGQDETGRDYACYRCGCTGLVTLAAAYEEYEERAAYDAEHREQRAAQQAAQAILAAQRRPTTEADYLEDIPF